MRLGYRISLIVIGVLLAISITIGSSYALWTITDNQETPNETMSSKFTAVVSNVAYATESKYQVFNF